MWPFSSSSTAASQQPASADKCPVDHETRQAWLNANPGKAHPFQPDAPSSTPPPAPQSSSSKEPRLSTERAISSIPRHYADSSSQNAATESQPAEDRESHWVYPSPQQFYNAMQRKSQNPQAEDMNVVVPIHNAVNEEAWRQILDWERQWTGGKEKDTKLINFKGRPKDLTWRAWFRGMAGYQHPFDRHDWTIDRHGQQVRYIIDFYTGKGTESKDDSMASNFKAGANTLSFFIDVRPAPSTVEGLTMRASRMWNRWTSSPSPAVARQS